jgi:hypothetical protein
MCDICKKYLNKKGKRNENIRNNNGEKKGVWWNEDEFKI